MDYGVLHLLLRCSRAFSHKKIRSRELSDTECMICSFICSHEDCSQDEVASALKMDKTTVGKALFSLEKRECVVRLQDPADKRRKRLRLTEKGHERISGLLNIHNEWLSEISKCLSPEEQKQFASYCARLLTAAEALLDKEH